MQRYSSMQRKRRKKGSQSVDLQRKIVRAVFIIGAAILLIIFFFGDHGVYQLYNLRQEKAEIQRSIAELRNEKQSLEFEKTRLETDYDYIVIDCAPRMDGFSKLALAASDLSLFPLGPSAAEIWSIEEMLTLVHAVTVINSSFDGRIVWNRFRSHIRSANAQAKHVRKDLKLPEMRQRLGMRISYSEAMSEGLTVHETDDKAARLEMWSLSSAVRRLLDNQKATNKLTKEDWLLFAKAQ